MLTPFDENGEIDFAALAKLTHYYIEAGATGLFANCLSSEMFELSKDERIAITSFVVKEVAGTVPVFSTGTFEGSLMEQSDFCKRIYDTGTTAVVAITSVLAKENDPDEILLSRVDELFKLTGNIPFGFYECPVPYKRVLSPLLLKQITDTNRVIYYKDTSLDLDAVTQKVKLTGAQGRLELYDAFMVNAVASLENGCAGLSCIQGNYFPELISWISRNFSSQVYSLQVKQAQQFLIDTMDVIHNAYPISAKYFLRSRNFPIGLNTRRKTGSLSPQVKKNIDHLSHMYDQLREQLGIKSILI